MSNLTRRARDSLLMLVVLSAACGSSQNERSAAGPESGAAGSGSQGAIAMTSILDKAARMKFDDYNPELVIDAVNALQPLGKQKAIDEITAYLAQAGKTGHDAV